jgi:hypothetical protein
MTDMASTEAGRSAHVMVDVRAKLKALLRIQ